MTNKNTEIIETQNNVDLKEEAKKQLRIATGNTVEGLKKTAKDFTGTVIDYLLDRFLDWADKKLSA
ncbi:hypothetical protein [Porcincola intestinalis]|uniref:hypothetical protein n=1 Tax=Porcincola intestinalis TaxID=2606632 RepID=UPI0023F2676F|nr:hypothetical protein [Porcincola intestinalis]MCI6767587.1 hypothetical protein [Lachnospiraceae bacterium]MDD7059717.1 hypothetical protein [Porcincola intestinalis]MDY5283150.1 hypothetical protein [Porcincola intestinalis]